VKRAGGEPDQFVPVINVAFASWLERAHGVAPQQLDGLKQACRDAGISRVARTDLLCTASFPFDASVLRPSRWRSIFEEQGLAGDPEAWGLQYVRPVLGRLSEPYPYVVCLVADGDRMGRAIDSLGSADEHRKFSMALARFAAEARKVVEQQHRGALIYAGGDDVLAFLPLPEALACVDALRKAFINAMGTACNAIAPEQQPTLSVGLGIGHIMESMGDLLTLGRQAEREAKRDRNALAVLIDKRSGGKRSWRAQWSADPVCILNEAMALLQDRIPSRKIYEIANILTRLPDPDAGHEGAWARVLALEVKRMLARVEGGVLRPEEVGLALDAEAGYATLHARVDAWLAQLIVARTFARAALRDRPIEEVAA
jgi:CRISPR-associated protein Cmr2